MLSFRITSFRERILLATAGIIILSQALSIVLFDYIAIKNAQYLITRDLERSSDYFSEMFDYRFEQLRENTTLLVNDFGFKSAIATFNLETINSAMLNHKKRLDADVMAIFNKDGQYVSSTVFGVLDNKVEQAFSLLVTRANQSANSSAVGLASIGAQKYQVIIVPVKAPNLVAYVILGFILDKEFAMDFKSYIQTDLTFVAYKSNGEARKEPMIMGSTVDQFDSENIFQKNIIEQERGLGIDFGQFITRTISIPQDNPEFKLYAVLQKPWRELFREYTSYRPYLMFITALLLAISIPITVRISRRVTRPVELLVDASERVEKGDYTAHVTISQNDELGTLADRFNNMVKGLAERDRMKFMAYHDGLTGLPNRRLVKQALDEALLAHHEKDLVSVLMLIDLDNFKPVNDTYGHDAGDAVLLEVAKRLNSLAARKEDLAARLGGDEFALLLRGIDDKDIIEKKAHELIELIRNPIEINAADKIYIGASVGIAYSSEDTGIDQWLKNADLACYVAKDAGKNTYAITEPDETEEEQTEKNDDKDEEEKT